MKVKNPEISIHSKGLRKITFELEKESIGECERFIDSCKKDKVYNIEPKEWREKRSLSANAYFWVLCGKLAKKLQIEDPKKTDYGIYKDYIRDLNISKTQELNVDFAKTLIVAWENLGTNKNKSGFFVEELDIGQEPNSMIYQFYYGSSVYNKKQMARLIDLIIFDCQEQGIETKTPNEIAELKARWGE